MKTTTANSAVMGKRAGTRQAFSHPERVAALLMLDAEGASIRGTARKLGIPEATLRRWANGQRSPIARAAAPSHRGPFAAVFERAV